MTHPTSSGAPAKDAGDRPLTAQSIRAAKGRRKLAMLTAYDYPMAAILDRSGVDMVLVGDSLSMVTLGRADTLSVTVDEMVHHCRAVVRGVSRALVVADMPFMSYEPGVEEAMRTAGRLFREGGARAVKLEGAFLPQIRALVAAGVPVMGHVGLTPQRVAELGGYMVQGKTADAARQLLEDARALEEAGCFALVLETIPAPIAARVTEGIGIPTIGIGAGPHCDGQVLVLHDMLGLFDRFTPRFVKQYVHLGKLAEEAVSAYVEEVRSGAFPGPEHVFAIKDEELAKLDADAAGRGGES